MVMINVIIIIIIIIIQWRKPGAYWRLVIRSDNRPVWNVFYGGDDDDDDNDNDDNNNNNDDDDIDNNDNGDDNTCPLTGGLSSAWPPAREPQSNLCEPPVIKIIIWLLSL